MADQMENRGNFLYVIKQLELVLRPAFLEACAEQGMTGAQYTALTVLERRPGITSSELARRSFVRAQTMAGTLDPLLESGLVSRVHDPDHGRRMLLYLTPKGSRAAAEIAPRIARLEESLLTDLSADERDVFGDFLRRCRHSLSEAIEKRAT